MYSTVALAVLPALSVAVQITLLTPAVLVSSAPQLCVATPEIVSIAPGAAVAAAPCATGLGLTIGLSVGALLSTLTA
jgi:hypothetical protein